jgi:predicted nuclease of predicted toxin-antitoxin system
MKLFLDQDVYAKTAQFLKDLNHDVLTARETGNAQTIDQELLDIAHQQDRILITRDRDFGGLVFITHAGSGVIYLRMKPNNIHAVHAELENVLLSYPETALKQAFIVVEAGRHRFRKLQ